MFLIIGFVVGLLLGLTGAGGSVFAVPLLLLLTDLSASDTMGIALAAVCVSAAYGIIRQLQSGALLTAPAFVLAGGGALAAPIGRWLANQLAEIILLSVFTLCAMVISLWMWTAASRRPSDSYITRSTKPDKNQPVAPIPCRFNATGQFQLGPRCLSALAGLSMIVGFLSGLLGVGGGFMIVPGLLIVSQASMNQAVTSSLFVITIVSAAGFASHILISPIGDFSALIFMVTGSMIGMIISSRLGRSLKGPVLQKFFAVALVIASITTLIRRLG